MIERLGVVFKFFYILFKTVLIFSFFSFISSYNNTRIPQALEDYQFLIITVISIFFILSLAEWIIKGKLVWK